MYMQERYNVAKYCDLIIYQPQYKINIDNDELYSKKTIKYAINILIMSILILV